MVNSDQFSKRLQKVMDEYDLNATSFADAIDVGRSSISHIISGRNKPSLEFVMKIIAAFPEVELYWLLNGKGSFPKKSAVTIPPGKNSANQLEANFEEQKESEQKETKYQTPQEYQNQPELRTDSNSEIERIVIFYKDGTFKNFLP
ncbi:DNA-binding XRE family transcriptional regulator [Leeuwenhoekiella aestuarii]|uniref:helix-turn-helix domain-containing protein n=1 Tax=Leeuwenhoekiella aestuarii TaxID=2249426 RepID=UPI000FFE78A3|nr:helix-turn-helix transcriptional regulator [Leeuwenhoekiella aestuarii]RXG17612.1 DNA-binding XRE family transcriptional regulator [Leeuwenhoekiella aestuarii]